MTVVQAKFREATLEESNAARGNFIYRCVSTPFSFTAKTWGTFQLWRNPTAFFLGRPPLMVKTWDIVKSFFGYNVPFIKDYPSFIFNAKGLEDPVVVREFFQHHRSDPSSVFQPARTMVAFADFMKDCFPNMQSFLLTCEKRQTKVYHALLKSVFSPQAVANYQKNMRQICQQILEKQTAENTKNINVTEMAHEYFIRIFGENILSNQEIGSDLSNQIKMLKTLISNIATKKFSKEDEENLSNLKATVQKTMETILENNPDIFKNEEGICDDDKKALILIALFAARDNTTTLLTTLLWDLSKNQFKQQELRQNIKDKKEKTWEYEEKKKDLIYPEKIERYFAELLKEHSPVPGIARMAAKDICLDYLMENETTWKKAFFSKGDALFARVDRIAKETPLLGITAFQMYSPFMGFGSGVHKCPGRVYAETSIKEFLIYILENFQFNLEKPDTLKSELRFTLELTEPVYISLSPIK